MGSGNGEVGGKVRNSKGEVEVGGHGASAQVGIMM